MEPAELKWRDFFADGKLLQIMDMALKNNRDLRLSALRVEKTRVLYGIQRAEMFPSGNVAATWGKKGAPADLSHTGKANTSQEYNVHLGLSTWEIDFFGRIRSLKDAALEQYLASEEAHRATQISLIASLAKAYLSLAADQDNLQLAQATLDSQKAAYDLIKKRYNVGVATELDLSRAQTQVETVRGDVARYTQLVGQDENTLNLLAGSVVPRELLPASLGSVEYAKQISAGIPSTVLLRRPDIMAQEHLLKAANANIGAARATLFPNISLTATFGTASANLNGLFQSGSTAWSVAPTAVLSVFDARTWLAYEATKVEKKIYLTQYEQTIQAAFKDVADALAVRGTMEEQLSAQQSLVNATADTYRLANARYKKGIDSYLSVLDAQRSLYGAQQGLITIHLAKLANQAQLYAVLGGGGELAKPAADRGK
jgi:multidrug efflux system outer membrane protein